MRTFENSRITFRIKNFRNIDDISLDLNQLTVLFGKNGVGKSSILKALKFLELNLLPNIPERTIYNLDDSTNLGSYTEVVKNNDTRKKVVLELRHDLEVPGDVKEIEDLELITDALKDSEKNYTLNITDAENKFEIQPGRAKPQGFWIDTYDKDTGEFRIELKLKSIYKMMEFMPFRIKVSFTNDNSNFNHNTIEIEDLLYGSIFEFSPKQEALSGQAFEMLRSESALARFTKKIRIFKSERMESLFTEFYDSIPFYPLMLKDAEQQSIYKHQLDSEDGHLDYDLSDKFGIIADILRTNLKIYIAEKLQYNEDWLTLEASEKRFAFFTVLNFLFRMFTVFPKALRNSLRALYLPSVRPKPKYSYLRSKYGFGIEDKDTFLNGLIKNINNEGFRQRLMSSLRRLEIAQQVNVKETEDAIKFQVIGMNNSAINLSEASSGFLQLFPILVALYLPGFNEKGLFVKNLIIEQPELHLHPGLQMKFIELVLDSVLYAKDERNRYLQKDFIIETHSEHILRKIQLQVALADDEKLADRISIYYISEKEGKVKAKRITVKNNGLLSEPLPDGFFDDLYEMSKQILFARKN